MVRYSGAFVLSLLFTLLAACSAPAPTQTTIPPTISPDARDTSAGLVTEERAPGTATVPPSPAIIVIPTPMAVTVAPPGTATGHPSPGQEDMWVRDRVDAIVALFNVSPAGREWLEGYDLRQMVGQPGWFGSFGYDGWAGVGQAIPQTILHEISHSYYGAFPVSGHPGLSWKRPPGNPPSPATEQYQQDLITFMFQPPDGYEPLRARLRNLPNLSREEDPDLFHIGEADLLYTTAGSLDLIPPILRKYFDQFLEEGDFQTWTGAIAWYLGLSSEDKKAADSYIGITHFPLGHYRDLKPLDVTRLPARIRNLLEGEERQRLKDFAQQFELIKSNEFSLVDAANVDRSFQFWRGYLREMLHLHEKHPQVLAEAGGRGPRLKLALDTFLRAEEMSLNQKIEFFKARLEDPTFLDFSVLLPSGVLIELFGRDGDEMSLDSVEGVVGQFARKLAEYVREVDATLAAGRKDLEQGSQRLEGYLKALSDDQQEKDLTLIIDLMRDTDRVTAKNLMDRLSDDLILRMLKNKASAVRGDAVSPQRLLRALKITPQHSTDEIVRGLKTLLEETSGNFQIDRPFTKLAYRVITDVGMRDYSIGLEILGDSEVPLLEFARNSPEASVRILSSDLSEAARLVANPQGYARSPQGIVYGLIHVDPEFAARLVGQLEELGERGLVVESVAHFAYDAARLRDVPGLPVSLEKDGLFLEKLLENRGPKWLEDRLRESVDLYRQRVLQGESPGDFLVAYRTTLVSAASKLEDPQDRGALLEMIGRIFQ